MHGTWSREGFAFLSVVLCCSMGCVANKRWQASTQPSAPALAAGVQGNSVAVVEFDGMGELWDRCGLTPVNGEHCQLRDALDFVKRQRVEDEPSADGAKAGRNTVVITYVHGWHHNAESSDEDFQAFSEILHRLQVAADAGDAACKLGGAAGCVVQRVHFVGVYIAWRGEVIRTFVKYATAFDREKAAQRTALVSMSEVLVRLRNAAKQTVEDDPALPKNGARFLLFGHSYGGMIVERSMAQMLTAALLPEHRVGAGTCDDGRGQQPFADLVFLINPAGDAIETEQLIDLMKRSKTEVCSQPRKMSVKPPLIVSIHARNDFWTGKGFAIGHTLESSDKVFRPREACAYCDDGAGQSPGQGYVYRHTGGAVAYFNNYCYIDSEPTGDPICERVRAKIDELKKRAGVGDGRESNYETVKRSGPEARRALTASMEGIAAFPKASAETPQPSRILNLYRRFDPLAPADGGKVEAWNTTPYWIFTVPKKIVDKHTGFWTSDFTDLISNIIDVTTPPDGTAVRVQ